MTVNHRRGLWWLPETPGNKIYGELNYEHGESSILSLDGSFVSFEDFAATDGKKGEFCEIILGIVDDKKITLVNCLRRKITFSATASGDHSRSEYGVLVFCIGFHFAESDELQFTSISVEYSHLRKWLGPHIFSFSDRKETETEIIISIKKPPAREIKLTDFTLKIKGIWKGEWSTYYDSYERDAAISIIFSKETRLRELFGIIQDVRNFLCLSTGEKVLIYGIHANEKYAKIEIVAPFLTSEKSSEDHISFYPMPIEFDMVSKNIDVYFRNWFSFIEQYEPAYQLLFETVYGKGYATTEFLNLSQAIEAYHSRKYENRLFSDESLEVIDQSTQFSKKIGETLTEDYRSAFLSRIKFINRKSLRMRIRDLFDDFGETFPIFIKDKEDFIHKVVETRNYYTHFDPNSTKPVEDKELPFLIENLRLIMITIILKEMGFENEDAKRIVRMYCRNRIQAIYTFP